jgi:hypothetical protein
LILLASTTDEFMRRGAMASAVMAAFIPLFIAIVFEPPARALAAGRSMTHYLRLRSRRLTTHPARNGHVAYQRLM